MNKKKNSIRKPQLFINMSLLYVFALSFSLVYFIFNENNDLSVIIPIVLFLPVDCISICSFVYLSTWEIEFNNDKVIYKNWFRKEKIMALTDLECECKMNFGWHAFIVLYYKNKKVTRIGMVDGDIMLLKKIRIRKQGANKKAL